VRAWGNQIIDIFELVKASIKDLFLNITSLDAKFTGTIAGWAEKIPGGGALANFLGMDVEAMKKAGDEADKEIEANKNAITNFGSASLRLTHRQTMRLKREGPT
jgi:hypothetical protein